MATDWVNSKIHSELLSLEIQNKISHSNRGRDLNKAFNEKFPNTDQDIYTDMEVNYTASVLKFNANTTP